MAGTLAKGKGGADKNKGDKGSEAKKPAAASALPAALAPAFAGDTAAAEGAGQAEVQVVTFRLADEEYAIDILQVKEILMWTEVTRMPRAPHFIEGIVNLRGQMVPIIDLRKRLGLEQRDRTKDTRIVIADMGDEIIGMVVDAVREVTRLPQSAIAPPPSMIAGVGAEFLTGIGQVGERVLIMLDLSKVLRAEEIAAVRDVTGANPE